MFKLLETEDLKPETRNQKQKNLFYLYLGPLIGEFLR